MTADLQATIEQAWENRDQISPDTKGEVRDAIETAINALDSGSYRVAEKGPDGWHVNQWLKMAVLLSFRLYDMVPITNGPAFPGLGDAPWWDKVPPKTAGWTDADFKKAGFRSFRTARFDGRPMSRRAWLSCQASSISVPMSTQGQ